METVLNNQFYDVILNCIADGVLTVDKDRIITSLNRAAERIIGVPRDEAVGRHCYDVFRTNICADACALERSIQTGRQMVNVIVSMVNAQGRKIPISVSTAALHSKGGILIGGVETFRDLSAISGLRKELTKNYTFEDIISKNPKVRKIFSILPDIAQSDSTVLIDGPSGSGKELFARAIHNLSKRREKRNVVINCGAIPETLLESEFFGYMKGAFTDAKGDKPGKIALAEGGTVFLDEVDTLTPLLQVKLLRVLQEREYEPLGATVPQKCDIRIIAASSRDLAELVREGVFRRDLYYRLNVIKIHLPPLADHLEDIPLLVDNLRNRLNLRMDKQIMWVSDEVVELLMGYDYPGNVRELENAIEHAFVLCKGSVIEVEHLPDELKERVVSVEQRYPAKSLTLLDRAERAAIFQVLRKNSGDRERTAQDLSISKSTLWRRMKKYAIEYS